MDNASIEALRREIEDLRAEREDARTAVSSKLSGTTGADVSDAEALAELRRGVLEAAQGIASHLATQVRYLSRERPILLAGVAFALGAAVGRIASRSNARPSRRIIR